jgi:hypothetical protein
MANPPVSDDSSSAPLYRQPRPVAVWVATGLLVLLAALNLLLALLVFSFEGQQAQDAALFGWMSVAFAVIFAVLAVFLFRGASWARYTVIGLTLLNLALAVFSWISAGSGPGCLTLLPQIILLVLMLQRPVADWCYRY